MNKLSSILYYRFLSLNYCCLDCVDFKSCVCLIYIFILVINVCLQFNEEEPIVLITHNINRFFMLLIVYQETIVKNSISRKYSLLDIFKLKRWWAISNNITIHHR